MMKRQAQVAKSDLSRIPREIVNWVRRRVRRFGVVDDVALYSMYDLKTFPHSKHFVRSIGCEGSVRDAIGKKFDRCLGKKDVRLLLSTLDSAMPPLTVARLE